MENEKKEKDIKSEEDEVREGVEASKGAENEERESDDKFYLEAKEAIKETIATELPSIVEKKMGDVQKDVMAQLATERQFGMDTVPQEIKDGFVHDIVHLKEIEARRVEPKILGKAITENVESADLVPKIMYNEIQRVAYQHGYVIRDGFRVPMTTEETILPTYTGSTLKGAYIANDATGRGTVTTPTFGNVTLTAKNWYTLVPVSKNLLADTNTRLYDFLVGLFAEGYAAKMDEAAFKGAGSGNDPFTGLLVAGSMPTYTLTGSGGSGTYNKYSGLDAANMLQAQASMPASLRRGAAWFMSPTMWAHLSGLQSSGNYILNSNNSALLRAQFTEGIAPAGFFQSYPVYETSDLPAFSTGVNASTKFAVFANLGKAIAMGDREMFTVQTSDEANYGTSSAFTLQQRLYMPTARYALSVYEKKAAVIVQTAAT